MEFMDALVDGFVETQEQLEKEGRKVRLSSSDGTRITVEEVINAAKFLRRAYDRMNEINYGTYKEEQAAFEFNARTCPEFRDAMFEVSEAVNNLENAFVYHCE